MSRNPKPVFFSGFVDCSSGLRVAHLRLGEEPALQATYPLSGPDDRVGIVDSPAGRVVMVRQDTGWGNQTFFTAYERDPEDGSLLALGQLEHTFELGQNDPEVPPFFVFSWAGMDTEDGLYTVSVWPLADSAGFEMIVAWFEREGDQWQLRDWITGAPLARAFEGVTLLPGSLLKLPLRAIPFQGARVGADPGLLHLGVGGEKAYTSSDGTTEDFGASFVLNLRFPAD